jgi:hypothetical protein
MEMKTKQMVATLIVTLFAIVSLSCNSDNNPTGGSNGFPTGLAGTWTHQSVTVNGTLQDLGTFMEWDSTTVKAQSTLNTDYTQHYEELDANDSVTYYDDGTFTLKGDSISAQVTSENGQAVTPYQTVLGTYQLNGNLLTLTMVDQGDTVVMVLTK